MKAITNQLLAVLREGFEGPPEKWSYFTDNDPQAGFFGTLSGVDAGQASRRSGRSTIAAHVSHMVFALEASTAWIRGDRTGREWSESWSVHSVDGPAWSRLLADLRAGYDSLREAVEANSLDDEEALGGAVGAIAHAAYHLGAVRQKIALERSD